MWLSPRTSVAGPQLSSTVRPHCPNIMRAPLILCEGGDISFFRTAIALTEYVESIDVQDGIYEVYDSNGATLLLSTDERRIILSDPDELMDRSADLATRLRTFLLACRRNPSEVLEASLPQLIAIGMEHPTA